MSAGFFPARWERAVYLADKAREQHLDLHCSSGPILVTLNHPGWNFVLPFELRDYSSLIPDNADAKIVFMGDTMELRAILGVNVDRTKCTHNQRKNNAACT